MHAAAVDTGDGFGQEAGGQAHAGRNLPREQLVELHLIGGDRSLGIREVHLELAGCNLRVVLFVLEAHRALHFGGGIDVQTQHVSGKAVVIPALRGVLERAGRVVVTFGIAALEQEAFDFGGDIRGDAVFGVQPFGQFFQTGTHVGTVGAAVLFADLAENEHLARTKHIRWQPVECRPINRQTQIGFGLRGETTDARAVEGQVVVILDQEFLVVIKHVQAALKVGEANRDGLDAFFVREVLDAFFLDFARVFAVQTVLLGFQVQLLELFVRHFEEGPQWVLTHITLLEGS